MTVILPTCPHLQIMDSTQPTQSMSNYMQQPHQNYAPPPPYSQPRHQTMEPSYQQILRPEQYSVRQPLLMQPYLQNQPQFMPQRLLLLLQPSGQLSQNHLPFAHQYMPHLLVPQYPQQHKLHFQPQFLPGEQNVRPQSPPNVIRAAPIQPAKMRPNPELRPGGKMSHSCYLTW